MRTTRLEERIISSLRYVFFNLLRLRLRSFLFGELLLLLSLLSLLGGHDKVNALYTNSNLLRVH